MIRSRVFLFLVGLCSGLLAGFLIRGQAAVDRYLSEDLPARRQLVRQLTLTDLALWTEARYTRNPAVSDLFSPFQDHPASFDHFPAGSLMAPTGARPQTTLVVRRRGAL